MIIQLIAGMVSCVGFAFLFNCPKKAILEAAAAGGLGWIAYYYCINTLHFTTIVATLIGTLVLSSICEVLARVRKDAVTVFVIPAILPLVPGAGLYYTLLYMLEGHLSEALQRGFTTLGCAMGIAIGIMVASSVSRLCFSLSKRGHS